MKSTSFGILILSTTTFMVVALASWIGEMQGQERLTGSQDFSSPPAGLSGPPSNIIDNELPARGNSTPGSNTTPSPQLEPALPARPAEATERTPTASLPVINDPLPAPAQPPAPVFPLAQPAINLSPIAPLAVPVPSLVPAPTAAHGPGSGCPHCTTKTCTTCCQPKCITKTILVPQWRTVWNSIFETRYKTEIKERAYTVEQEVEHQVPHVTQYTVQVPEPRIRTFQDFRTEEYQEAVEEPYSVMVRKPKQRKVAVDREETYKVPFEEPYTVMVPQEREVAETKYKTIIEKEAKEVKYSVDVEREKKRWVMDYEEQEVELTKRVPYTRIVKRTINKKKLAYKNVTQTITVQEPFLTYVNGELENPYDDPNIAHRQRNGRNEFLEYVDGTSRREYDVKEQVAQDSSVEEHYTVAVPELQKAFQTFLVSEPYQEDVQISWESREQVPRQVTRDYSVKIPYIENFPRQYKIKVPHTVMKKGFRTIPKQIPRTRYQTVKRDEGKWVTDVSTIPTVEVTRDHCGCSTCCPQTRTVRRTKWQPRIVTSRVPYTVFETVKEKVPYEYPVVEYSVETRDRMEPVTRYRIEKRQATLEVLEFVPSTETKTVKVTKYRQVPMQREITLQRFRQERKVRNVPTTVYTTRTRRVPIEVRYKGPNTFWKEIPEEFDELDPRPNQKVQRFSTLVPKWETRDVQKQVVVRTPYLVDNPEEVEIELKDFRDVKEKIKVKIPRPRIETTIEKVPEIRTRIEYVNVEKEVPYVETKTVTEMVPQKRTRTVYKTESRTVAELKTETYFVDEEEVFTRTVYKTKTRDVPVNRAEISWVNVPKVLQKTVFKKVKRKVKRPALQRIPVKVPYQVEVRIPRKICTLVPQTITIPVEECCEHCVTHLPGAHSASQAWIKYAWGKTEDYYSSWFSTP